MARATQRYKTKREASAALAKLLSEADAGLVVERSRRTVAELLEYWLQTEVEPRLRASTAERYAKTVRNHLIPGLGGTGTQSLTATQVQKFLAERKAAGVGQRTLLFCHQNLHQALDMAVRLGWVARNVTDAVPRPRYEPKKKEVWSLDQLARFLEVALDSGYGPIWLLLAETGMRRGEALGLRWRDLDLSEGALLVAQTLVQTDQGMAESGPKTEAGRRILHLGEPTLVAALRAHRVRQNERRLALGELWQDHDLVFCSEVGTPILGSNLWRHYRLLVEKAGVPPITIHGIRHTVASQLIASGWDVTEVAYQLGHSKPSITSDIYAHVLPHRKKALAQALGRIVMGEEGDRANERG